MRYLGGRDQYADEGHLDSGGLGMVRRARVVGGRRAGRSVVLKFPNLGGYPLDPALWSEQLKQIRRATDREFRAFHALQASGCRGVARLLDRVGQDLPGFGPLDILVYEFIDGLDLPSWCCTHSAKDGVFRGVDESRSWLAIARPLLSTLARVHEAKLIHGDIWPRNIRIVQRNGRPMPVLLDFGSSTRLESWLEIPDHLDAWYPFRAPEVLRPLDVGRIAGSLRPRWYAPVDVYGVGGVLMYLALGD